LRTCARPPTCSSPPTSAPTGVDGWVSLEVSPLLADDSEATIEQAERLHIESRRNNIFIKIPGTMAGAKAIEESIHAAIPINVTLLFSTEHYLAAAEALHARDRAANRGWRGSGRAVGRLAFHQALGQGG